MDDAEPPRTIDVEKIEDAVRECLNAGREADAALGLRMLSDQFHAAGQTDEARRTALRAIGIGERNHYYGDLPRLLRRLSEYAAENDDFLNALGYVERALANLDRLPNTPWTKRQRTELASLRETLVNNGA